MHVLTARHRDLHGADGGTILEDASIGRKGPAGEFVTELDGHRHVEGFPVHFHAFAQRDIAPRDQNVVVRVQQQQWRQSALVRLVRLTNGHCSPLCPLSLAIAAESQARAPRADRP